MTDRELLEMAAKAAGKDVDLSRYDDDWGFAIRHMAKWWNPLTDDGDAVRLAVQITRDFEPYKSQGFGWIIGKTNEEVRRAIVRAAAEIGKEMK